MGWSQTPAATEQHLNTLAWPWFRMISQWSWILPSLMLINLLALRHTAKDHLLPFLLRTLCVGWQYAAWLGAEQAAPELSLVQPIYSGVLLGLPAIVSTACIPPGSSPSLLLQCLVLHSTACNACTFTKSNFITYITGGHDVIPPCTLELLLC